MSGGFAGKLLRVDLSTGKTRTEPTAERYGDVLGGCGLGYRVLWDDVPAGTSPFDAANKVVFASGVLAGTGAPCNGRMAVTTLFPSVWPKPLVASGHMGGHFAAKLKYAGYDGIVVEGKADRPVWLFVRDGRVELRDATRLRGLGIRRTTLEVSQEMGADCVVAAIGPAGENGVPLSVVMNSVSHSAGGVGAVLGSKNLKAIGVQGSGAVRIAGDRGEWEKLVRFHLSILGANNQHVVPRLPHPQAEYYDPGSRWVGAPGKRWGAAEPPVEIGGGLYDLDRIAYRSNSGVYYLGEQAWARTVRGNGCTACPVRCHTVLKAPDVAARYGVREVAQGTCLGLVFGTRFFRNLPGGRTGTAALEAAVVGLDVANDLGVWCNYGQLQRDLTKLYYDGILKAKLGAAEYASYRWDRYEKGDPSFLHEILPRVARREGELAELLGLGTGALLSRWSIPEEAWSRDHATTYWKLGHPKHHANEDDGQCGVLVNTQYNRDPQCHSLSNFTRNGLPLAVQKKLAEETWGSPDAVDAVGAFTPMNAAKARRARWGLVRKELHDGLGLCNWMGPWVASPLRERGYAGDDSLESRLYSLATGRRTSRDELDAIGERIFVLHRALTIRDMGTVEMRGRHDLTPQWLYEDADGAAPFTKGTIRMDRNDIERALDLFYDVMGWDRATGAPTAATYARVGLGPVGDALAARGLVPRGGR